MNPVKCLIVMYHYVIGENHFFPGLHGINFNNFKKQIERLTRDYQIISLSDYIANLTHGEKMPKRVCVLTFDDGLKEHASVVVPYLAELGIRATFFIPTSILKNTFILTPHKIHLLMAKFQLSDLERALQPILSEEERKFFDPKFLENFKFNEYPYDIPQTRNFKYFLNFFLGGARKEEIVSKLFNVFFDDESEMSRRFYVSAKEIAKMAKLGHEIGSHTHTHRVLSALSDEEIKKELAESKEILESIVSGKIEALAYPYGTVDSFSQKTVLFAQALKFKCGLTAIRGFNEGAVNPFFLKRYHPNDI